MARCAIRAEGTGQPLIRRVAVFADSLGLEEPERLLAVNRADQVRFAGELLAWIGQCVQHAQADRDQVHGHAGSWSTER